jgi:hypothetical protein
LVSIWIIKAAAREIYVEAIDLWTQSHFGNHAFDFLLLDVPSEVIVLRGVVVENSHEYNVFVYETANDIWVGVVVICHCKVIKTENLINIDILNIILV